MLCVTIAHQEDAKRYKGAVTFFNEQLMPLIGVTKWETLDNARQRAVNAGRLEYVPGNRGQRQPGRYWVTIPKGLDDLADAPCDESQYPAKGDRGGERDGDRGGEHSTLSLNPIPKRKPAGAGEPPGELLELIDGWNELGHAIVREGNGARRDPPAKAAVTGWRQRPKSPSKLNTYKTLPALLAAIRGARFCHGKPWFSLPWLFAKNDKGEFNIVRLMAGVYNGNGEQRNGGGNGQQAPSPRRERRYNSLTKQMEVVDE